MRVAVMAAGAVGGYFGGRVAAAGHNVAFIARGAHRDAIRRDGLKIESALGDLHLRTSTSPMTRSRSDQSTWCCSP
jgi:2-dehydropantoate 2-reductase